MKLRRLLLNKYSISILLLLLLLGADVILHKGMTRVMIPSNFSAYHISDASTCDHRLKIKNKEWIKGVNTIVQARSLEGDSGFETDVYFDNVQNTFFVYHDSSKISSLKLDSLLIFSKNREGIWLDIKNLTGNNNSAALNKLNRLRDSLKISFLVESTDPESLKIFCNGGYPTIYYVPFFNPYTDKESFLMAKVNEINTNVLSYPASALSGYYFQYPLLRHSFPSYPLLTWSVKHQASAISYFQNRQMYNDTAVKIILYPQE